MIIGRRIQQVRTMISTPFFAIGPTSTPWYCIGPVPPRVVQQGVVGQKHLALARDADAHAGRPRSCGMSRDWIFVTS